MSMGTVPPGLQALQSQLVGLIPAGIRLPGLPEPAEATGIIQVGVLFVAQRQDSLYQPM